MGQGLAGIPVLARLQRLLLDAGAAWAGAVLGARLYSWISSRAGALTFQPEQLSPETYHVVLILSILSWIAAFLAAENGDRRWRSARDDLGSVVASAVLAGLFLVLGMVGLKLYEVSRGWLLTSTVLTATFAFGWRLAVRLASRFWHSRAEQRGEGVLLVGDGPAARAFQETLRRHPETGLRFRAWLRLDGSLVPESDLGAVPATPTAEDAFLNRVQALLRDHRRVIDHVMVAIPLRQESLLRATIDACRQEGKSVHLLLEGLAADLPAYRVTSWFDQSIVSLDQLGYPTWQIVTKRLIDIVVSALGLVLTSPLLLVLGLLIKLESPGPVFFAQTRIGLHGRPFRCYKLRSMVKDAEERLRREPELYARYVANNFKLRPEEDPRITRIGRFLRATSVDELPQLWNVLKGEMSLVGPRPIVPEETRNYGSLRGSYLTVKPGLTGYWQVAGRSEVDYPERAELDDFYVTHWSLWLDIQILFKTIGAILRRQGAY